jgi:hypothetical protein
MGSPEGKPISDMPNNPNWKGVLAISALWVLLVLGYWQWENYKNPILIICVVTAYVTLYVIYRIKKRREKNKNSN